MKVKKRLDHAVQERYPTLSRAVIQSFIMQGKVTVDGQVCIKPGMSVSDEARIVLSEKKPLYVSRAGLKLAHALDHFALDPAGLVVLDSGLSTGGFTDCLLQRGAKKVYGIDVGYGQVHETIRNDPRVVVMERTNLRHLTSLPEKVDLVTLDLSFISLLKVIPAVKKLMKNAGVLIALIKPQFEAEKYEVGRGGVIKDPALHKRIVKKVVEAITQNGFTCKDVIKSPLLGAAGNQEFLVYCINSSFTTE